MGGCNLRNVKAIVRGNCEHSHSHTVIRRRVRHYRAVVELPKNKEAEIVTSLWKRARAAAERTPESRNRYADFLRAVSIGAVVIGHWLMLAPFFEQGQLQFDHVLHIVPWAVWLTWVFQVMPVFFMVGGYSMCAASA